VVATLLAEDMVATTKETGWQKQYQIWPAMGRGSP